MIMTVYNAILTNSKYRFALVVFIVFEPSSAVNEKIKTT